VPAQRRRTRWKLGHHGGRSTRIDIDWHPRARPGRLLKLLRERLERTRLAEPVESVELAVEQICRWRPRIWICGGRAAQSEHACPSCWTACARGSARRRPGPAPDGGPPPERAFVRTERHSKISRSSPFISGRGRCGCCPAGTASGTEAGWCGGGPRRADRREHDGVRSDRTPAHSHWCPPETYRDRLVGWRDCRETTSSPRIAPACRFWSSGAQRGATLVVHGIFG